MHLHYRSQGPPRRRRRVSSSDTVNLVTTVVGLVLLIASWSYFHSHFLADVPGSKKHEYESRHHRHDLGSDSVVELSSAVAAGSGGGSGGGASASSSNGQSLVFGTGPLSGGSPEFCEEHFGMEWVRAWNATQHVACTPARGDPVPPPLPSSITCRSPDPDDHLPTASSPHMLCDAVNLRLDPAKLRKARCPKHRPGYLCTSNTYHRYQPGAWAAACDWPGFSLDSFSKDHMQDIFESLELGAEALHGAEGERQEELPTLIVTREANEHANVYHTLTDMLNVYITLTMLGWGSTPRQVLILDNHRPASLDLLWPVVAAGGGQAALAQGGDPWKMEQEGGRTLVRRVAELKGPVVFRRVAFVPPGYASLLFAHLYQDSSCQRPTSLFQGFRRFMLEPFGLAATLPPGLGGEGSGAQSPAPPPLRVRLVSRKPSRARRKMARQIANEEELVQAMQAAAAEVMAAAAGSGGGAGGGGEDGQGQGQGLRVEVSKLDLGELSLPEQLAVVGETDVLVAMHGAALAYTLLMHPHAAVVELWPQADGIWRCYEHFSRWGGLLYRRLANADPALHVKAPSGDKTTVDAQALGALLRELLPEVQRRRRDAAAAAEAAAGQAGAAS